MIICIRVYGWVSLTPGVCRYLDGTPARSQEPGLLKLRTSRILCAHMVLTVEPGCYFIPYLLNQALAPESPHARYLNRDLLLQYYDFGGVRLEDDVVVSPGGLPPRNLTTCPRLVEEVEAVMAGGVWPPVVDNAPYLYRQWCELESEGKCMKALAVPVNPHAAFPI